MNPLYKMQKYLFYFGYIGTRFSGVIRDPFKPKVENSISYYIEEAIQKNLPSNASPTLFFSSRTDAGVHAVCSTFDCEFPSSYPVHYIVSCMNKYFMSSDLHIRIYKVQAVPPHFSSRFSAVKRTYLYRLAHIESPLTKQLPICEMDRSQLVRGKLNMEAIQEACQILKGQHDFRYYTKVKKKEGKLNTERTLTELKIVPGTPLFDPDLDKQYEGFNFWDVILSSRGFLYNQVRRKVAFLIAVGQGQKTLEDVESTLSNPNQRWDRRINLAAPGGLYLFNVEYPPEAFLEPCLQFTKDDDEQIERKYEDTE